MAVLVELKARFDEARNVGFANKLEHAGCNVAYGAPCRPRPLPAHAAAKLCAAP